jgi:site-specific DNA-methyltransferase (adenine-specific)
MSHKSENCKRLKKRIHKIRGLNDLSAFRESPATLLMLFPASRSDSDAVNSHKVFEEIAKFCEHTNEESTICILTSAPDAARLLPYLTKCLRYQLWIAIKTKAESDVSEFGQLSQKHAALLVLTRYKASLRHTLTRIAYTFCPACGKTTKDYGGKKHIYNPFGTLLSDVWRDIECDPATDTSAIEERLQDMFGLSPYEHLEILDLRECSDLQQKKTIPELHDDSLPLFCAQTKIPSESKLINDDCLKALSSIPESSVDFCFADPPYNIQKKYDHWNDALEMQEYFAWCDSWLSELARVLKPGRTLAVINIPLWAVRHYQHLSKTLQFQSWIAWDGLSLPVRMIMPSHYAIVCFSKGEPRPLPGLNSDFLSTTEGKKSLPMAEFFCVRQSCLASRNRIPSSDRAKFSDLWYDIHRIKHNSRRVDHPCQLPPALMRRLFSLYSKPGETVLDCFDGAGTSTLVAHQMNRKFIGIELSAQYHKIAQERHEMIARGDDPFGKRDSVPQAKNSRVNRLPKQKYVVSKKTLQLEVRQIARKLGRLPTHADVKSMSKFPIDYFDNYFFSWGEVCAAARHEGMSELPNHANIEKQEPELFQLVS